jgi:hypothetical protein
MILFQKGVTVQNPYDSIVLQNSGAKTLSYSFDSVTTDTRNNTIKEMGSWLL